MSYHGYTNHFTWLVNIWNDEYGDIFRSIAIDVHRLGESNYKAADAMRHVLRDMADDRVPNGLLSDIINSAIDEIDFDELADLYIGEVEEEEVEEEEVEEEGAEEPAKALHS